MYVVHGDPPLLIPSVQAQQGEHPLDRHEQGLQFSAGEQSLLRAAMARHNSIQDPHARVTMMAETYILEYLTNKNLVPVKVPLAQRSGRRVCVSLYERNYGVHIAVEMWFYEAHRSAARLQRSIQRVFERGCTYHAADTGAVLRSLSVKAVT